MRNRLRATFATFLLWALAPTLVYAQESFRRRVIEALPKLDEMAQGGIRAGEVPGVAIAVVLQDVVGRKGSWGPQSRLRSSR